MTFFSLACSLLRDQHRHPSNGSLNLLHPLHPKPSGAPRSSSTPPPSNRLRDPNPAKPQPRALGPSSPPPNSLPMPTSSTTKQAFFSSLQLWPSLLGKLDMLRLAMLPLGLPCSPPRRPLPAHPLLVFPHLPLRSALCIVEYWSAMLPYIPS